MTHLVPNPCHGQEHQVDESPIQPSLVQLSYGNHITRSVYFTVLPPSLAEQFQLKLRQEHRLKRIKFISCHEKVVNHESSEIMVPESSSQCEHDHYCFYPSPRADLPVSTAPRDNPHSLNAGLTLQWFLPSWGKVLSGERTLQFTNHMFCSIFTDTGKKMIKFSYCNFFSCQ